MGQMGSLTLAGRIFLAAMFALAAGGKVDDLEGTRRAVAGFGVPPRLSRAAAVALPAAELAVAIGLLVSATVRWGAISAVVLMAAFTVAVGAAMSREEAVDCHCFGRLHSAPATARALIRNCALLAVAGLTTAGAFSDPGPSATRWISRLSPLGVAGLAGGVLVLAVLAAQSWLIVELLRRNGRLLRRLDVVENGGSLGAAGLPVGSPAPRLSGEFTGRSEAPLHVVRSEERAAVLVFVEWGCAPCAQLLSELANGPRASAGPKVTVIGPGPAATAAARQRTFNLREVIVDEGGAIAASYGVRSTPSAVGVTDGAISSPLAEGAAAVRALLGSSAVLEPIRAIEAYGA